MRAEILTPWRRPQRKRWLIFDRLEKPRKRPRVHGVVRAVLEGAWGSSRTPDFTKEIVGRSLENRDTFYHIALQNAAGAMLQGVQNANLLTRIAAGDPTISVQIPVSKPRGYRRYLAKYSLTTPSIPRGEFDKVHFPRFVQHEARRVRELGIRDMRASLLVALAQDLDRVVAPQYVREQERIALARKIVAIPVATAVAAAGMVVPIPGSAAYGGYQTYRLIAGGQHKDVFEEGVWWRERRTDAAFRKVYKRLVRGIKPVIIETMPGGRTQRRKLSYTKRHMSDLMRVIYFTQPDDEFIRANMAVEYYNTLLLKVLTYLGRQTR